MTRTADEGNDLLDDEVAVENFVEDTQNLMFFDFVCTQDDGKHVAAQSLRGPKQKR
jgi:hypothetical protein